MYYLIHYYLILIHWIQIYGLQVGNLNSSIYLSFLVSGYDLVLPHLLPEDRWIASSAIMRRSWVLNARAHQHTTYHLTRLYANKVYEHDKCHRISGVCKGGLGAHATHYCRLFWGNWKVLWKEKSGRNSGRELTCNRPGVFLKWDFVGKECRGAWKRVFKMTVHSRHFWGIC